MLLIPGFTERGSISVTGSRFMNWREQSGAPWLPPLLRRGYEVHNGFDDDEAGHAAARTMHQAYPLIHRLTPPAKDWNASLHRWA